MQSNYSSLVEFAQEIERREAAKVDLVSDTRNLFVTENGGMVLHTRNGHENEYPILEHAQRQMCERAKIPSKYFDQCAQVPGLRAMNLNAWFNAKPENRMVRVLDRNVRAFVSDQFKPFDNFLVTKALLPALQEHKNDLQIKAQALTDSRMYLQLVFPRMEAKVAKVGDVVQYGLTITNSEIGAGAVDVASLLWTLRCMNGMIGESVFRKIHVGRKIGGGDSDSDEDYSIYKNDTIQADLIAFEKKLRDTVAYSLRDSVFQKHVARLNAADEKAIPDIPRVIENVTRRYTELQEKDGAVLTNNIVDTGNRSLYGLANAITFLAHEIEDRDRSFELEKLGARLVNVSDADWTDLTTKELKN